MHVMIAKTNTTLIWEEYGYEQLKKTSSFTVEEIVPLRAVKNNILNLG